METWKNKVLRTSGLINVKGAEEAGSLREGMEAPAPSQCFVLCVSSIWLFLSYILLGLTGNLVSLGSVSCSCKLGGGHWNLRLVRSTGNILNV